MFISPEAKAEGNRKRARAWHKKNPEKAYFYILKRRMLKKEIGGEFSSEEWETMKKKYKFTCPCCFRKEPEIRLTIDHIKPLLFRGRHEQSNIQPLCHSCNCKKHTKEIKYELCF